MSQPPTLPSLSLPSPMLWLWLYRLPYHPSKPNPLRLLPSTPFDFWDNQKKNLIGLAIAVVYCHRLGLHALAPVHRYVLKKEVNYKDASKRSLQDMSHARGHHKNVWKDISFIIWTHELRLAHLIGYGYTPKTPKFKPSSRRVFMAFSFPNIYKATESHKFSYVIWMIELKWRCNFLRLILNSLACAKGPQPFFRVAWTLSWIMEF